MAVELGDIIGQIGTGVYRLVKGKDVNITDADALSTGSDDDIILVDEDAQGLQSSTKKLSLSNLWNYILSKFISTSSTTQVLYNQSGSIKGEADFVYDESNNKLTVTKLSSTEITGPLTGNVTGNVTGDLTGDVTGNLTGNVTGNVSGSSGSTTGNAASATSLATARNIGGVSFDGTADIDLPGVNTQGNQDTTGNSATVTSIGTLTGDVTSTNRVTTIANDIVGEPKLRTSNAPTNGYALTAQSGNTGGLTWAEISSGNTYTAGNGITLNTLEFDLDANLTTVISLLNSSLVLGRDADNQIKFSTDNQITFRVGANDGVIFKASGEIEATTFDGNVTGDLTGNVAGDVVGDVYGNANTATALAAGNQTIDGNVNIGSSQAGHDFTLHGATTLYSNIVWDASNNFLKVADASKIVFGNGLSASDFDSSIQADGNNLVIYNDTGNIQIGDTVEITGDLTVTGTVEGDVTGNVSGSSGTVTSIGNLTGDVTSTNRATTIANDIIDEAKLRTSNTPTNGYVLTAQSGNTGGLTWAESLNLSRGVTTTAIYLAANEFNVTSHSTFSVFTKDQVGSVKPTAYQSRGEIFATSFIPLGYEVTDVDIYASQNRNIEVLTSRIINDSTTSRGTGTSNTTLTLGTAWESASEYYLILSFEQGAVTDEIYGAKITIQAV
jgi:hypothetical protein